MSHIWQFSHFIASKQRKKKVKCLSWLLFMRQSYIDQHLSITQAFEIRFTIILRRPYCDFSTQKKGVTQYFEKIYDNCRVFVVVHHIRPSLLLQVVLSKEKSFSITHVHATLVYLDVSILLQGFVIRDTDQFRLGLSHLLISLITLHRTNSFSFGFENHGSFGRSYGKSPATPAGIYVLNF